MTDVPVSGDEDAHVEWQELHHREEPMGLHREIEVRCLHPVTICEPVDRARELLAPVVSPDVFQHRVGDDQVE